MPALVGLNVQKGGGAWGGALVQTYKCLNKQLGRFSFFEPLKAKPHCDRRRDYNHLAVRLVPLHPQHLIMDEIHLYVAIIALNCFFEGDSAPAASG